VGGFQGLDNGPMDSTVSNVNVGSFGFINFGVTSAWDIIMSTPRHVIKPFPNGVYNDPGLTGLRAEQFSYKLR